MAILCFLEDLEKFCLDLNIKTLELSSWQEDIPALSPSAMRGHGKGLKEAPLYHAKLNSTTGVISFLLIE